MREERDRLTRIKADEDAKTSGYSLRIKGGKGNQRDEVKENSMEAKDERISWTSHPFHMY